MSAEGIQKYFLLVQSGLPEMEGRVTYSVRTDREWTKEECWGFPQKTLVSVSNAARLKREGAWETEAQLRNLLIDCMMFLSEIGHGDFGGSSGDPFVVRAQNMHDRIFEILKEETKG